MVQSIRLGPDTVDVVPRVTFRVAQTNHRTDLFNAPELTYPENPYTNQPLGTTYSSTSTAFSTLKVATHFQILLMVNLVDLYSAGYDPCRKNKWSNSNNLCCQTCL